ncbi:MAG: hypothetical protein R3B89_30500, partial [Polyangiaceae bacterium]
MDHRSRGSNRSEALIAKFCDRAFLRMWSYANPFARPTKELCDILVAHDDALVLFSIKECAFGESGDDKLDWQRWYRRAISKSAKQIQGAERWLRRNPSQVFLDPRCTKLLPTPISPDARIHRVVVPIGAAQAWLRVGLERHGFTIAPQVTGDSHFMTVGTVGDPREFIHVFDEPTLLILLNELDTTPDFIAYLTERQRFIESGKLAWAPDEEGLLALYLDPDNPQQEYEFPTPPEPIIAAGGWEALTASLAARRTANTASYTWDVAIETLAQTATGDANGELEKVLRIMSSESRLARRWLSDAMVQSPPSGYTKARYAISR